MGRPAAGAVRPRVGRRRDPRVAAVLSVVPGLGQLYNLQPVKAAFFLLATILTIGPAVLLITAGERLGTTLLHRGDGTAFLLLALGSVIVFLARPATPWFLVLLGTTLLYAIGYHFLLPRLWLSHTKVVLGLLVDVALTTEVIRLTGYHMSLLVFLYYLIIIACALTLETRT